MLVFLKNTNLKYLKISPKEGQKAVASVLEVVNEVCKRWTAKLKEYQDSGKDLGTFKFSGEDKDASRTIGALITIMNTVGCTLYCTKHMRKMYKLKLVCKQIATGLFTSCQ